MQASTAQDAFHSQHISRCPSVLAAVSYHPGEPKPTSFTTRALAPPARPRIRATGLRPQPFFDTQRRLPASAAQRDPRTYPRGLAPASLSRRATLPIQEGRPTHLPTGAPSFAEEPSPPKRPAACPLSPRRVNWKQGASPLEHHLDQGPSWKPPREGQSLLRTRHVPSTAASPPRGGFPWPHCSRSGALPFSPATMCPP